MPAFTTHYVPHLLYSLAITSLGMHILSQRKSAEAERLQLTAQLIMKLVRSHRTPVSEQEVASGEEISWREVMLGRKKDVREEVEEARRKRAEEWDRRDMETVQKEVQSSGS
ncbi:uncharacterized protein B0H18DRAFT_1032188 [Fomitopsis serialis]|uniref:uncharacterized protein n=1 Tax=Fomitopsis serialis TaxID=139415 RepID=UPI0020088820|nr:uncharacterized protein B0H18DRAFT_1032188 [Neoantrodia serialis]KAH9918138.1 hypothetical protein B0H18DRAFT_1032188 [Neoantrodia serialis]